MVFLRLIIISLLVSYCFVIEAQNYTISGHVYDAKTNKELKDVNIIANKTNTISNTLGYYEIVSSSNSINFQATAIGYSSYLSNLEINKDTVINIYLKIQDNNIKTVTINAEHKYLHNSESIIDLPIVQIQKIPSLAGEQDILKALQLTPGIQGGTEGSTGLNVRGGSNSQNLILLDGIPIYNASHLFGFMSVFNADAISKVKIYKGGFPSYYGGRLASIIRIDLKDGNNKKPEVKVNIGLISAKIFVEAPLNKNKTSFIISGRTSYLNLFYKIPNLFTSNDNLLNLGLYETNIKIKHKFTDKTKLVYGLYFGKDYFKSGMSNGSKRTEKFTSLESIGWGNLINYS